MSITAFADNNTFNVIENHNHSDNHLENIIQPYYEDIHPCHSSISHKYCSEYSMTIKSCGCYNYRYQCCCGEIMPIRISDYYPCDSHMPSY